MKIAPKELNYANHKRKMINEAFNKIKIWNMVGAYLEFGVYRGQSIIFAYYEKEKIFGKLNSTQLNGITRIYAFDSFQGIKGVSKSEINGPYKEGDYSASYAEFINNLRSNNIAENQIEVIPGFFEETLTENLYAKYFLHDSIAAVVNIDCDIYEPAKLALNFVKPMLRQGSIVLFDDWYSYALDPNMGEVLALREFLAENTNMQFMFWKDYGPVGRAYIVSISTST